VKDGNGLELLEQKVVVDYAFVRPPPPNKGRGRDQAREDKRGSGRGKGRSRSPGREGEDMED
jgi:RNA-binding protein 8A